jgi:hypothetical protein
MRISDRARWHRLRTEVNGIFFQKTREVLAIAAVLSVSNGTVSEPDRESWTARPSLNSIYLLALLESIQ